MPATISLFRFRDSVSLFVFSLCLFLFCILTDYVPRVVVTVVQKFSLVTFYRDLPFFVTPSALITLLIESVILESTKTLLNKYRLVNVFM